mmetsp:Transcript_26238/g.66088  ORF Transcript_26238/g.66088 Transcript_26238/m.66088 type:complete len:268 (-) Transcript_26238:3266-4069(-)
MKSSSFVLTFILTVNKVQVMQVHATRFNTATAACARHAARSYRAHGQDPHLCDFHRQRLRQGGPDARAQQLRELRHCRVHWCGHAQRQRARNARALHLVVAIPAPVPVCSTDPPPNRCGRGGVRAYHRRDPAVRAVVQPRVADQSRDIFLRHNGRALQRGGAAPVDPLGAGGAVAVTVLVLLVAPPVVYRVHRTRLVAHLAGFGHTHPRAGERLAKIRVVRGAGGRAGRVRNRVQRVAGLALGRDVARVVGGAGWGRRGRCRGGNSC